MKIEYSLFIIPKHSKNNRIDFRALRSRYESRVR